jgi:hypothetical protein
MRRAAILILLSALAGCGPGPNHEILGAKSSDVSFIELRSFSWCVDGTEDQDLVIRDRKLIGEIVAAFQDACGRSDCPCEGSSGAASAPDQFFVHYKTDSKRKTALFELHSTDAEWGSKVAALYKKLPLTPYDHHPNATGRYMSCQAVATGAGEVSVYWKAEPGAASYRIYRATDPAAADTLLAEGSTAFKDIAPGVKNGFRFVDKGLTEGNAYVYRVAAVLRDGAEKPSLDRIASPHKGATPFDASDPKKTMVAAIANGDAGNLTMGDSHGDSEMYMVDAPNGLCFTSGPGGRNAKVWAPDSNVMDLFEGGKYRP